MGLALTAAYQDKLREGQNTPDTIIEVELDSGTVKWGSNTGVFSDVLPIVSSVGSLQNVLDFKKSVARSGDITVVIEGRDNFKALIRDEYLKNRRVNRMDGFIAPGYGYSDYVKTFTGLIRSWKRTGDTLTITVADDKAVDSTKIPVANATNTQTIDYRNANIIDVAKDIAGTQLPIPSAQFDGTSFDTERDTWYYNWNVNRVLHRPQDANSLLAELSREGFFYVFHNGAKVACKAFAPLTPGQTIPSWNDDDAVLKDSLICDSGYENMFFNSFVIYYDYDESGNDGTDNYESGPYVLADADSQSGSEWDETKVFTLKSRWNRTYTHTETSNITGVEVYHVSKTNGAGNATLTYDDTANTLTWTAPGGNAGDAVELKKDGAFQVWDADKSSYCRVVVTAASLPGSNQSDTIAITPVSGAGEPLAAAIAGRLRSYYRDPVATVEFKIDLNQINNSGEFLVPTDLVDVSTDEAFEKGEADWLSGERLMITSVRPDFVGGQIGIKAVETKFYLPYRFISALAFDYDTATQEQKDDYGWIADGSNLLGAANDPAHVIWHR